MTISRWNPDELHDTAGYSHITLVEPPATAVYLAGQMPLTRLGTLVHPELGPQVDQTVENALVALGAAGADPGDVVRSVVYVVAAASPTLDEVWRRLQASALGPALTSASTLLGVTMLGVPGQLVEVELTAVRDRP